MAGDTVRFSVVLEDKISGAAGTASKALGNVEKALTKTGDALANVEKSGSKGGKGLEAIVKSAKAGLGPMGGMFERVELLRGAVGAGGLAAGAAAGTLAVVALAAAAAAGAIALGSMAISAADAARTENILAAGLLGSAAAGAAYQAAISSAVTTTGAARDSLSKYARQLVDAKVSGADLSAAIQAAAQSSVVLGDEGAAAFVRQATEAAKAGQSVRALAADVDAKLGGLAAKRMLSLDSQANRLKESMRAIVSTFKIDPVLAALSKLTSLLDQNSASGQAIGFALGKAFEMVSAVVERAAPFVEQFFKHMIVYGLQAYIALAPTVRKVQEFLEPLASLISPGEAAGAAFYVIAGSVALMGAAIALAMIPLGAVALAIVNVGKAITWTLQKLGLMSDAGAAIPEGLARGIEQNSGIATAAAGLLATQTQAAAKGKLGIASPSKVFAELGKFTAEGFSVGLEAEAPAVQAATGAMVAPPSLGAASAAGASAAAAAPPSAASSGGTFAGSVTINISGIPGASELEARLPEILASAFEAIGLSLGSAPPASPVASGA